MENLNFKWAVFNMIDRKTQDDKKSKANIDALFENPVIAEDLMNHFPNKEVKRYILRVNDIERFEDFYNYVQDLNDQYGEYAIYHLKDGNFTVDEENRFRSMLGIWTNTEI